VCKTKWKQNYRKETDWKGTDERKDRKQTKIENPPGAGGRCYLRFQRGFPRTPLQTRVMASEPSFEVVYLFFPASVPFLKRTTIKNSKRLSSLPNFNTQFQHPISTEYEQLQLEAASKNGSQISSILQRPVTGTSRVSKQLLKKREIAAKRQMQGQLRPQMTYRHR
jgi:hypothetical protein